MCKIAKKVSDRLNFRVLCIQISAYTRGYFAGICGEKLISVSLDYAKRSQGDLEFFAHFMRWNNFVQFFAVQAVSHQVATYVFQKDLCEHECSHRGSLFGEASIESELALFCYAICFEDFLSE